VTGLGTPRFVKRRVVIPEPVASSSRWINWTARKGKGRTEKIPISPKTGRAIDPTERSNGTRLSLAAKRAPRRLGLLINPALVAIDIDLAVSEGTREVEPWAMKIVEKVNSYSEISPSGLGLHILAMGAIPSNRKKPRVEMYHDGRFMTFTGDHLASTPTRVEVRVSELRQLWKELFGDQKVNRTAIPLSSVFALQKEDGNVLQSAVNLSPRVAELYEGNARGYPSQSEADLALCSYLAMVTDDQKQVDRIFRTSGLMRAKWNRKDYSTKTILRGFQSKRKYPSTYVEELLIHYEVDPFRTPTEWAIWFNRFEIEKGKRKPAKVQMKALETLDLGGSVEKVYNGLRLLFQCHWLRFPGKPVLFSERFAAKWCGVGSEATAWRAIQRLQAGGYIYVADVKSGSIFGDTPMYLPVTDLSQVKVWRRPSVSEPPDDWKPS
jgi:hypothetical protein